MGQARGASHLAGVVVWALTLAYIAVFCLLSLRRYDAFLMHALDMGNMEQAVWNTARGLPFHFTNMLDNKIGVEAFGTDTRLSFHVEPIFFLLTLAHLLYPGPQALLVVQTVVVASGALAVRRLARRRLPGAALAEVAFPLAYLLFPAVQAANLYEFHPVTLTAALLLWAFEYADAGAYLPFGVAALAAMACKEEIGLAVAAMALWMILRGQGSRAYWLLWMAAGAAWTAVAFGVVIPHFSQHTSPYACRLVDPLLVPAGAMGRCPTTRQVLALWVAHPESLWAQLTLSPKLGYLHRLFVPTGYLALLSPLTLLPALPGLILILLSREPHMYSGVAHYSAELAPAVVVAALLGVQWLAYRLGPRLRLPSRFVITGAALYLLAMSLANTQANGFGPFTAGYLYPQVTEHERIGHRLLALIPPGASVAAGDMLDPHLSDRADIFLYPWYTHTPSLGGGHGHPTDYIFLDMTTGVFPLATPALLVQQVRYLLNDPTDPYSVVEAQDGYLLLKHGRAGPHSRPRSFYSFMLPAQPRISHPLVVDYGPSLRMLGYDVERAENVNLRAPDVIVTTYWRVTRPLGEKLSIGVILSNADGAISFASPNPISQANPIDQMALDWLPTSDWQPGQIVRVRSLPLTVYTLTPGAIDLDLVVVHQGGDVGAWGQRIQPIVRDAPQPLEVVEGATLLKLASMPVPF